VTDDAIATLAPVLGTRAACAAVGRPPASHYRRHRSSPAPQRPAPVAQPDRAQPRALSPVECQAILDALHSDRFVDLAPTEVWAILLDEGVYLGSVSTFYRLLRRAGESRERRVQATHPAAVKPELVATGPNQVFSWDITKLHGPAKWSYFYLYVILDIYSRYVVGWMVASRESAALAETLIRQTCAKQNVRRDQLTLHADRGSSMTSKPVALLLADLGVTQSHSRPHVSNDNPYSEAQFKTLKYRPDFPTRFASIEAARVHCQTFFGWYNDEHRHTGLGLHVPADVHYGRAQAVHAERASVLDAAYAAHPERFVHKPPAPPSPPTASWINEPEPKEAAAQ
jgi:putative transposase